MLTAPIQLRVYGLPKAQPRPRAFASKGRARVYDPSTAEAWKSRIAEAVLEWPDRPVKPLNRPLSVEMIFLMPRPRDHFGTGRRCNVLKPSAPKHHLGKPDIDNLAKAVLDALKHLDVWRDDTCVVRMIASKQYVEHGAGMRLTIAPVVEVASS